MCLIIKLLSHTLQALTFDPRSARTLGDKGDEAVEKEMSTLLHKIILSFYNNSALLVLYNCHLHSLPENSVLLEIRIKDKCLVVQWESVRYAIASTWLSNGDERSWVGVNAPQGGPTSNRSDAKVCGHMGGRQCIQHRLKCDVTYRAIFFCNGGIHFCVRVDS